MVWGPQRRAAVAKRLRTWLPEAAARAWVAGLGAVVVAAWLLAAALEPVPPYGSSGNVLAIAVLLGALALWSRRPLYSYASGLMINIVGLLLYCTWVRAVVDRAEVTNGHLLGTFVSTQVVCFAVASAAWSALERALLRRTPPLSMRDGTLPFAQAALVAGVHLLALLVGLPVALQIAGLWTGNPMLVSIGEPLAWGALAGLALAALASLWDDAYADSTRYHLHASGLLALGLIVQSLPLTPDNAWYAPLLLGGYTVAVSALARRRQQEPLPRWDWAFGYQAFLASVVAVLSLGVTFTFAGSVRGLAAPLTCGCACATWAMLTAVWKRVVSPDLSPTSAINFLRDRQFPRSIALLLGVVLVLEAAWTIGDPDVESRWLQRIGASLAVLTAMASLYRLAGRRLPAGHAWRPLLRGFGSSLVLVGYVNLLLLLALEIGWYDAQPEVRTTPLAGALVVLDGLAVLGLMGLSLYFALTAEEDSLGLPAEFRGFYVYAAELSLAGLLVHLRLNVPDLLPPVLGRYWTLTLLVVAFGGVGLSEYCFRRRRNVLAYPLRRTAVVLGFVPVLAYLVQPLAVRLAPLGVHFPGLQPLLRYFDPDRFPGGAALHALCWLLVGLLHGWLARLRKSPNQLLLAALCINLGVWALLDSREELALWSHPQLWLIPLGLILLAAEFINRARVGPWPSTVLRSLGLLCVYLSSTFDMLLTGLGNSVLLPIVLAVLSVLGVLLGILLRMRAMLLFGSAFLGVVIFAQIWHAAVDREQAWVWWASGLVLGLAIVALFAYFEKHRGEVLRVLGEIRHWE
jgi:hypothetical protein